jgi:hypothetical protein
VTCDDVRKDGTHPPAGAAKIASILLQFFKTDRPEELVCS